MWSPIVRWNSYTHRIAAKILDNWPLEVKHDIQEAESAKLPLNIIFHCGNTHACLANLRGTLFWKTVSWLIFRSRTAKPYFPVPGSVPRPREYHVGIRPIRINVDQVSAKTVDSAPKSWDLYRLWLLGGVSLALSLVWCQELGPVAWWLVQTVQDRLSKDCLLKDCLLKCRKTVFQNTVPRRLELVQVSWPSPGPGRLPLHSGRRDIRVARVWGFAASLVVSFVSQILFWNLIDKKTVSKNTRSTVGTK